MDQDFTIPSDIMPIVTMERESLATRDTFLFQGAKGGGNSSMSVIIESLLDLLLSFYEQDEARRSELMGLMWESLVKVFPCSNSIQSPALLQLRGQYQKVFKKLIRVSQKKLGFSTSLHIENNLATDCTHLSRYHSEFDEIEYLAKGGFGSVFRVRNKLDHFEYAIKKILLKCDKDWTNFAEVTKEVIMLAKLTHPNIVNYKTAWIEPTSIIDRSLLRESTSDDDENDESSSSSSFSSNYSFSPYERSVTEASQSILFLETSQSQITTSERNGNSHCSLYTSSNSVKESLSHTNFTSEANVIHTNSLLPSSCLKMGAILYLQMELCETTLREWMDNRATSGLLLDSKVNTHIFTQILEGVAYIHSQGIIHRDLKPRNIFIRRKDNTVQIGDFGLAKEEIQSKVVPPESPLECNVIKFKRISSCVGTQAYASPEQLSYGLVDYKSDIYSLGIILYELFSNFKTGMERSIAITNLKEASTLDSNLQNKFPQIAQYILWLTNASPHSRPTARELLNSEFSKEGQLRLSLLTENMILKKSLETKDKELEDCRSVLADREKEIEFLKKKLLLK